MNTQQTIEYLGLPVVTKLGLSQMLGVSPVTLHKYHDVALRLPDFVDDYPLSSNKLPLTSAPLTEFQIWVLSELVRVFKGKRVSLVYLSVKNDSVAQLFSRKSYESQQQQDYKIVQLAS